MANETRTYTNGEVTITWKPDVCIHSTLCWKGLIEVFNPTERPWIKMDGASTEKIVEQVRKCPSGALSYEMNSADAEEKNNGITGEAAHITRVEVSPEGPYLIKTECVIVHASGMEETKTGTVALCRCGASATKPYCDGSHRRIGFKD